MLKSDPKIFQPYEMHLIKDFNCTTEYNQDLSRINYDHFEKKGLILNFQKV